MNRSRNILREFPPAITVAMGAFVTCAALIASAANPLLAALPFTALDVNSTPHPAVARIIAIDSGGVSRGSGTLIDVTEKHGLVITNWHVVRDATEEVIVSFPGGFQSSAKVIKVDDDWDLAVLVIWRPPVEPVALASEAPKPGDPLTIAGYGPGKYRAASGRCTQYVAPGRNLPFEMVEVSVEARNGDSGGPIFNDRGELAGVLFGASRGRTSGGFIGRVRWFVASVMPAVTETESAIASVSPPQPIPVSPNHQLSELPRVAKLPERSPSRLAAPRIVSPLPDRLTEDPVEPPADTAAIAKQDPAEPIDWRDLFGHSIAEQAKSALALIGVMAVLIQFFRISGSK